MVRRCDCCKQIIEQPESLEIGMRALKTDEDSDQEADYVCGDFCDTCAANRDALKHLLQQPEWTLEPKP